MPHGIHKLDEVQQIRLNVEMLNKDRMRKGLPLMAQYDPNRFSSYREYEHWLRQCGSIGNAQMTGQAMPMHDFATNRVVSGWDLADAVCGTHAVELPLGQPVDVVMVSNGSSKKKINKLLLLL